MSLDPNALIKVVHELYLMHDWDWSVGEAEERCQRYLDAILPPSPPKKEEETTAISWPE